MTICKRCGQPFESRMLPGLKRMALCCETCSVRNLFDNLDCPTPPELLDRYTKDPALTDEEFKRRLKPEHDGIEFLRPDKQQQKGR